MAEVGTDTSSYPKPGLPVSPIDIASKIGGLQQQKLQIDQAKLDQANQGLTYLARAVSALGPNATEEQYKAAGDQVTRQLGLPPEKTAIWNEQVDAAKTPDGKFDSQGFFKHAMSQIGSHQEILQMQTGANTTTNDSANVYQGKTDVMTGGFTPATQMPVQQAPGTEYYDPNNQQKLLPPSGPPGVVPVPRPRMPVQQPASPSPAASPVVPAPAAAAPAALNAAPTPMFAASQAMLAKDRETATAKATALKPLEEAHDLAKLVSTGAGTETLNKARAYLTNAGLMNADEKNPAVIYQMLNKNLAGFVDKNGTRSDADLAVKESSNANAKTQVQPALLHMIQKIIGREKIEIARPGAFEDTDVGKYSQHSSKFPTSQDERAYTIDKMKPEDAKQLYIEMKNKALNGKGADQAEGIKFLKSLSIAKKQGLINGLN